MPRLNKQSRGFFHERKAIIRLGAVAFVLTLVSLFCMVTVFAQPSDVKQKVSLLDYKQEGKFGWKAYLNPSYVYDTIPLQNVENPPGSDQKFDVTTISTFDLTFTYHFTSDKPVSKVSIQTKITQLIESPQATPVETTLADETYTGPQPDSTTNFPLNAAAIPPGSKVTIQAKVYITAATSTAPVTETFTQSLIIQSDGPVLDLSNNLTQTESGSIKGVNFQQSGQFDYSVKTNPQSILGGAVIESSHTPPQTDGGTLTDTEGVIFTNLVKRMDMSFDYKFVPQQATSQTTEEVSVVALLESPKLWSKTIVLVPDTTEKGNFSVGFPLDLQLMNDLTQAIQKETGVSGDRPTLTIKAMVDLKGETAEGQLSDSFIQTLTSQFGGGMLQWVGSPNNSATGSIQGTAVAPKSTRELGLPVDAARIVFPVTTGILFMLFSSSIFMYSKLESQPEFTEEGKRARKKHKGLIVDVAELPSPREGEAIVIFNSLDQLACAAETLMKPVLHKTELDTEIYWAIDGMTRYEYRRLLRQPEDIQRQDTRR